MNLDMLMNLYAEKSPREKLEKLMEVVETAGQVKERIIGAKSAGNSKDMRFWQAEYDAQRAMCDWLYSQVRDTLRKMEHGQLQSGENISRRTALLESMWAYEEALVTCSKSGLKLEPMEGQEKKFDALRKKYDLLRELVQALDNALVKQAIAGWQNKLMREKESGKKR